eukprot:TRINITY_DN14206_c0_g1_i1.p1 TRINITY_DN14206_c0_g1~~TRINITY_DN14206_c0_g1_i1.p1  ORF type:complete len:407 (-),score=65.63 TRINITY_DN14206_c0_g1_i1:147-1367(-)
MNTPIESDTFLASLNILSTPTQPQPKAELKVVEQHSLAQDKYSKDAVQKELHIVVKNMAFKVSIGLTGNILDGRIIDFNCLTVIASLVFDCETNKEVPFFKQRPVEYKGHVNDRADVMNMDVKIKVLTSHCENMLFRLKFACIDPRTNKQFPSLVAFSAPIKVISKPDQLKRKRSTGQKGKTKSKNKSAATRAPAKKRVRVSNDKIMESLQRLEEQYDEQKKMLARLAQLGEDQEMRRVALQEENLKAKEKAVHSQHEKFTDFIFSPGALDLDTPISLECAMDSSPTRLESPSADLQSDFGQTFQHMLRLYQQLPAARKAEQVRKCMRATSAKHIDSFCEMISLFKDEGLNKYTNVNVSTTAPAHEGSCATACPHKKELQQIEKFYSSFLSGQSQSAGQQLFSTDF